MVIVIFFIVHWYAALFFQSIFHHRYAAHRMFTMSKGMVRLFHIGSFLTQGSSYISASAYAIMHRLHHANADMPEDPHSPKYSTNALTLLWKTRNNYINIYTGKTVVEEKYKKNLPDWKSFDKFAHSTVTRIVWIAAYVAFYAAFATAWWQWLLLPATILISPLQGLAINWWAHKFGYVTYVLKNTSKNILPVDIIFWGESYHNNHHKHPSTPNYAVKWFEIDPGYIAMILLNKINLIHLKKRLALVSVKG